jgi:hypothetical protein
VYSFALKPEEHQPSGTCNFSRIDNATLMLTLSNNTVGSVLSAQVRVYAVNYNVLRIMSGINEMLLQYFCTVINHLCSTAGCHPRGGQTVIPASSSKWNCKMTWLRETPYSLCYYHCVERRNEIQGNDLGYSKNAKDWAIRRREPKPVMIGHGSVSETAKASVIYEGLINLRSLKVQSSRWRKSVDKNVSHGVALLIQINRVCFFHGTSVLRKNSNAKLIFSQNRFINVFDKN